MIAGLNVLTYMKTTYSNCLEFIQDFMCLVIGMFLPKGLTIGIPETNVSSLGEPLKQYIKFALGSTAASVDSSDSRVTNIGDKKNKPNASKPVGNKRGTALVKASVKR